MLTRGLRPIATGRVTLRRGFRAPGRGSGGHGSCSPPVASPLGRRAGAIIMRVPDSRFRRLGEQAGIVLLRAALVLSVVFALANSMPG